jgi:hypothetical protein
MTTKMWHLLKWIVCSGLVLSFVVSCKDIPEVEAVSFADLCLFNQEDFMHMSSDEVFRWIENAFGHPPTISVGNDGSSVYVFNGSSDRLGEFLGNVRVYEEQISEISLHNIQAGPRFDEVVMGLGEPATVYHYCGMAHEPLLYTIGLDYPVTGISVFTSESKSRRNLSFEGGLGVEVRDDMRVTLIQCYQPASTIEEVISRDPNLTATGRQLQLQNREPWGGFGSIVRLTEP